MKEHNKNEEVILIFFKYCVQKTNQKIAVFNYYFLAFFKYYNKSEDDNLG